MRVDRRRPTFLALCYLEEMLELSKGGRVAPSLAIRLALAHLYSVSSPYEGVDPLEWHRTFWRELTQGADIDSRTAVGFGRLQTLNSHLNGIAHAAGMPRDHLFDDAKARLRRRRGSTP